MVYLGIFLLLTTDGLLAIVLELFKPVTFNLWNQSFAKPATIKCVTRNLDKTPAVGEINGLFQSWYSLVAGWVTIRYNYFGPGTNIRIRCKNCFWLVFKLIKQLFGLMQSESDIRISYFLRTREGCKQTAMVLRFDCRGTISIESARERPPPSGSKSEYQRGPPGLFHCWIDSIGDKCLKANPMVS